MTRGEGGRFAFIPSGCVPPSSSLASDFPRVIRECRVPDLRLEELLRERRCLLQGREEFQVLGGEGGRGMGLGWFSLGEGGGGPGLTPSDPSVQEELEFCERLLQLCFETPTEESTMDR